MQPAPSSGGGPPHGTSPQASAAVRLLAAVQRREDAAAIRARLASLPPPSHDAEWLPWLGNLLHAALDRPDDPGVLTALLSCLVGEPPAILEGGGGGGPSPAGSAAATTPGLSPLLQQLLTSALQRGGPGIVGVVLRHCGGDLDMPLPAFPSGMLAFSCYTGNLRLIAALLDWGADHQRALDLLSPPAAVGIRWDAACVALLQRAQRAYFLHKLRLLREYARPPSRRRSSTTQPPERASSSVLAGMVERAAGAGGGGAGASDRRSALPTVELMSLEVQMERQLRIGSGGTGGGGGGQRRHQQQAAAPAPAVGRPLAVLEYVLDGMPLPAFQRLVGMMGRF